MERLEGGTAPPGVEISKEQKRRKLQSTSVVMGVVEGRVGGLPAL